MRVGIILCGRMPSEVQHAYGTYQTMFRDLFARTATAPELVYYDATVGEYPGHLDECDGYVGSGSRGSAYDEQAWYPGLRDFLYRIRVERAPFVGVCFSHQMIAQAFGGFVEKSMRGWGVGVHTQRVLVHEEWMEPSRPRFSLVAFHEDHVTRLPADAKLLASSDHCPIAMFRLGNLLGIQCHPEFTPDYARPRIEDYADTVGESSLARARESFRVLPDSELVAGWIIRFICSCRDHSSSGDEPQLDRLAGVPRLEAGRVRP